MAVLTKRVQFVLPESLWQNLAQQAQSQNCSVSALIREAVMQVYFAEQTQVQKAIRSQIVDEIAAMNLPVADWEPMERESTSDEW